MGSRMAGSALLRHLGPRLFSASFTSRASPAVESSYALLQCSPRSPAPVLLRLFPVRMASTSASPALGGEAQKEDEAKSAAAVEAEAAAVHPSEGKLVSSYWGIERYKITKEDGTPWRWSCFMVSHSILV